MSDHHYGIRPEDYVEPRCVLCGDPYGQTPQVKSIPQQRIIQKMDEYMAKRDYAGAERHLLYWMEEAKLGQDLRGQLMLHNELIGHYRKTDDREKAMQHIDQALALVEDMDFGETLTAGTTYVNAATACNAFGENERSLALFEKARKVYESGSRTDPALLGGLYNNMALTCSSLGRYEEAFALYEKALSCMDLVPNGRLEKAITLLNMAQTLENRDGMEKSEAQIYAWLDEAAELLKEEEGPDPGYYAFVCEKCAPSFSYYGYFLEAEELMEKARRIYGQAR